MDAPQGPDASAGQGPRASLAELRARLARVIPELAALAARGLPTVEAPRAACYAVTGVGGSHAPARLLVATLRGLGQRARFVPLSAFAEEHVTPRPDEALCVFSQGLSPNASLPLAVAPAFREAFLFTSVEASAPRLATFVASGGQVLTLPPPHESAGLLRVLGPPLAMLAAVLFAHVAARVPLPDGELERLAPALLAAELRAQRALAALPERALRAPLAFVTSGRAPELGVGLAIKWLEGLGRPEPPVWDVLEIAHGPFHVFYTEPRLLVALGAAAPSPLVQRLAGMLAPDRHALVHLPTALESACARLEIEVAVNALFLAVFAAEPRELSDWPSKGLDEALYGLTAPPRS